MSQEPSGAIDHDFDDAERDAREQIMEKLSDVETDVEPGDIAIDLVYHRPIFVRRQAAPSCADYWDSGRDFDLVTYKVHPYLPVAIDDPVFECVYLPTKPGDITHEPKSNTYDFPAGRLVRVPVELLWGSRTRYRDDYTAAIAASILSGVDEWAERTGMASDPVEYARSDVADILRVALSETIVKDAHERAGIDYRPDEDADDDGGDA